MKQIESCGTPGMFPGLCPDVIPFLLSRLNKVASRSVVAQGDSVSAVKRIPNALSATINRRYSYRSIIPYLRASKGMHARLFTAPHRTAPHCTGRHRDHSRFSRNSGLRRPSPSSRGNDDLLQFVG